MADYRAFIVGEHGHFNSSETIVADDDAQALRIAEKLINGHDIELWRLFSRYVPGWIRASVTGPRTSFRRCSKSAQ
jgi:hypothetical protein